MKNKYPFGIREILYYNDTVDIIYEACTACYNNTKDISYLEKKKYIEKRVMCGHESVLEHGFVSLIIHDIFNKDEFIRCLSEITGPGRYLSMFCSQNEDESYNIMIGGSVRAYKNLIKEYNESVFSIDDEFEYNKIINNFIINHIYEVLYETTVKEFYSDIKTLIPEYNKFQEIICNQYDKLIDINDSFKSDNNCIITDKFEIIGSNVLNDKSKIYDLAFKYGFFNNEVDTLIPVTILFKNMSRTSTHQLVRHRNAITQESQRYVNYDNAGFTIPDMSSYINDYKTKNFNIELFGNTNNVTLEKLSKELISIYKQLKNQGLRKEDARAFLPSNIQCGRLYMTFTLSSLNKAISLRTDPHAQSEIRQYFIEIEKYIN